MPKKRKRTPALERLVHEGPQREPRHRPLLPVTVPGTIAQGNIDMNTRPAVPAPEGGTASVRSMSIGTDRGEVLIPTVGDEGVILPDEEAIRRYHMTGRHLGITQTPEQATALARLIHLREQARLLGLPLPPTTLR